MNGRSFDPPINREFWRKFPAEIPVNFQLINGVANAALIGSPHIIGVNPHQECADDKTPSSTLPDHLAPEVTGRSFTQAMQPLPHVRNRRTR
jgi:hypothetical protein